MCPPYNRAPSGPRRAPQLLVQDMTVTEWRRRGPTEAELNPGCNPLVSREGWSMSCPEDTQQGAPFPPPRGLPKHGTCPPFHSNPLQRQRETAGLEAVSILLGTPGVGGWESRQPSERRPSDKTSKCFTNKSGPLQKTCPGSRTLGGGCVWLPKSWFFHPRG